MFWTTSIWTQQFGVFSCLSHYEIICKTYDLSRIYLRSLWNNYSGQLRSWSKNRRRSQDCPRLTGTSLCGGNHLCCVMELFELWNPKPTSFQIRRHVWKASVQNQLKPGNTKLSGIWNHAIWKNWIEMMGCRRSSSGKYSQDSLHCASSKRFKNLSQNYSVNLSSSKTGSSSCQCTTTLYGENEETQKSVRNFQLELRIMFGDSRSDVGHFWDLNQRRNGTELILINEMEIGTRLLNKWCSTLQKAVIPYFVPRAPWKERQSDVEKNTRRCKWRKSHSKIKADDEFGIKMPPRLHLKTGNTKSESQKVPLSSWNVQQTSTESCIGRSLIKLLRMEHWRQVVFPSAEIWWNVDNKYDKTHI